MAYLFELCLAPVAICSLYLYVHDRYEKEPIFLLGTGLLYGAWSAGAVTLLSGALDTLMPDKVWFMAFVSSAGVEEAAKLLLVLPLIWHNPNFNEPFDGIVYAAFVALGFALIENVVYLWHPALGGMGTAIRRAIFSVPGHGLFGVMMGYEVALAKFSAQKGRHLILAFLMPWIIHSIYNWILLLNLRYYLLVFLPYLIFLWGLCLRKMRKMLEISPFRRAGRKSGDFSVFP